MGWTSVDGLCRLCRTSGEVGVVVRCHLDHPAGKGSSGLIFVVRPRSAARQPGSCPHGRPWLVRSPGDVRHSSRISPSRLCGSGPGAASLARAIRASDQAPWLRPTSEEPVASQQKRSASDLGEGPFPFGTGTPTYFGSYCRAPRHRRLRSRLCPAPGPVANEAARRPESGLRAGGRPWILRSEMAGWRGVAGREAQSHDVAGAVSQCILGESGGRRCCPSSLVPPHEGPSEFESEGDV